MCALFLTKLRAYLKHHARGQFRQQYFTLMRQKVGPICLADKNKNFNKTGKLFEGTKKVCKIDPKRSSVKKTWPQNFCSFERKKSVGEFK